MLAGEPFPEGLALDKRHDIVEQGEACRGGHFSRVDQSEDMGMLQVGRDADLTQEPVPAQCGGKLGVQYLEGDGALMLDVVRQEDGRHAAATELSLDRIPAGKAG